ncbi:hypothetical protein GON26_00965 [Flavobacterium sp. GA093]|uniref:Uncharacterized protein n=1 Tax=Flavobacterium hydrocarbonoxydans TaxID=2683249 RepID=A0A6I4NP05_9FLAO|nr:hypothetical protein [Flavobacterium hydrocarbonoxydans]MWB92924.1 hypothetical protein [Flavobacterium hydrocarbonoxydans]
MDRKELKKDASEWLEEYLKTVEEKLASLSRDELEREMKNLESEYTDQQLEKFTEKVMIASLKANCKHASVIGGYVILDQLQNNAADADILKSVSGLIQTISKAKEDVKTKEMNTEFVEKLKQYEEG